MIVNSELYEKALKYWDKFQILMVAEEASELSKAACKLLRNDTLDNINHLAEEFADVLIMKEQMEVYFKNRKFREKIFVYKIEKLERLQKRIHQFEDKL